jgi:hypothetical protein
MLLRPLALAVLAALTLYAAPRPAAAADLGDGYSGSPYDDPRYPDIRRHPPRRDWSQREDSYDDDDDRSYARDRDDDDDRYGSDDRDDDTPDRAWRHRERRYGDYLPPMTETPRFSDDWRRGRYDCVARWRIRHLLQRDGWHDIRSLSLEGPTAIVRATRRESGRTFDLRVDRCSGAILSARRSFGRAYGLYQPPR